MARSVLSAMAVSLLGLGGCSAAPKPVVGQIAITNASGVAQPPVGTLQRGASIYLDVVVSGDAESLGVDWTVTCSSSLPEGSLPPGTPDTSCGSFVPYHTLSGPIPSYPITGIVTQFTAPATVPAAGTITIVAHATSLPARTSALTLTIM